ncbi:hypothetical protein, partial [Halorubrum yunnanense]
LGRCEVLCGAVGWDSKGQSPAALPPAARGAKRLAAARTKARDARTAGTSDASDEGRSERTESSRLGLWRCFPPIRCQLFISERLGLWRYSRPVQYHLLINE